eukprot:scaffold22.g6112.t1
MGDAEKGKFKGATTDVDKRHGDPSEGGLTSGEKSAVSRGYMPSTAVGTEKEEAARAYAEEKGKDPDELKARRPRCPRAGPPTGPCAGAALVACLQEKTGREPEAAATQMVGQSTGAAK